MPKPGLKAVAALLQSDNSAIVTTKASGTGLGLAVVKKIADEHNARIELKNKMQDELITGAQVSLSFRVKAPLTNWTDKTTWQQY